MYEAVQGCSDGFHDGAAHVAYDAPVRVNGKDIGKVLLSLMLVLSVLAAGCSSGALQESDATAQLETPTKAPKEAHEASENSISIHRDSPVPTPIKEGWAGYTSSPELPEAFVAVSTGLDSHCALRLGGAADCAGAIVYDSKNFLPRSTESKYERGSEPRDVGFIDLSAGHFYICGLLADGKPFCWGEDRYGEASPPAQEALVAISSSRNHTCALRADSSPVCWGLIQLPESLLDAEFIAISSGVIHTCALYPDGSPICWSRRRSEVVEDTPVDESFITISSGGGHTCGLRADGSPVCWGNVARVKDTPEDERFIAISSGDPHTCALRADGSPVCWGQLDLRTVPSSDEKLIAISSGSGKTCGIRFDGTPVCWTEPFTSSPPLPGTDTGPSPHPSPWTYEWSHGGPQRPTVNFRDAGFVDYGAAYCRAVEATYWPPERWGELKAIYSSGTTEELKQKLEEIYSELNPGEQTRENESAWTRFQTITPPQELGTLHEAELYRLNWDQELWELMVPATQEQWVDWGIRARELVEWSLIGLSSMETMLADFWEIYGQNIPPPNSGRTYDGRLVVSPCDWPGVPEALGR